MKKAAIAAFVAPALAASAALGPMLGPVRYDSIPGSEPMLTYAGVTNSYYAKDYVDASYFTKAYISNNYYDQVAADNKFASLAFLTGNYFSGQYVRANYYDKDYVDANYYDKEYVRTNFYTRVQVEELLRTLGGRDRRFPVFCIELNGDVGNWSGDGDGLVMDSSKPTVPAMWTSFELKASTNNFFCPETTGREIRASKSVAGGTPQEVLVPRTTSEGTLLFYCYSEPAGGAAIASDEGSMRTFALFPRATPADIGQLYPDQTVDNRSLTMYGSAAYWPEGFYPKYVYVVLDPSRFSRTADASWCTELNEDVVWAYVRHSAGDVERDSTGRPVWHPVQPVRWYADFPKWAYTNGEERAVSSEMSGEAPRRVKSLDAP